MAVDVHSFVLQEIIKQILTFPPSSSSNGKMCGTLAGLLSG